MRNLNPVSLRLPRPFHLLDSFFADNLPEAFPGALAPATNIAESADSLTISFELPGVDEKDIQLEVHEGRLSVQAVRKDERDGSELTWHRYEQRAGQWSRTLILPESANTQAVEATYRNGILTVTIKKRQEAKPTRVQIKGA